MKRTFMQWLRGHTLCLFGRHSYDYRTVIYTFRYRQKGSAYHHKGGFYLKRVRYEACPCCGKRTSKYREVKSSIEKLKLI